MTGTDCEGMRDRLPHLAAGILSAGDAEEVQEHLKSLPGVPAGAGVDRDPQGNHG